MERTNRAWVKSWKQFQEPGFKPSMMVKEALGVRRVEAICKEVAAELGVQYSKEKPVRKTQMTYTKVVENTFMVGGAKIFTRSSKVPGMRGNFDLFVVDPATDKGFRINIGWDGESTFIDRIKEMVTKTSGAPVNKVMTKEELDKIVNSLGQDGEHDDSQAFDIADSILLSEEGMEDAIRKYYGVEDVVGWLANRV